MLKITNVRKDDVFYLLGKGVNVYAINSFECLYNLTRLEVEGAYNLTNDDSYAFFIIEKEEW